ncbi:MAG: histidinol-phosphatase HisJ family protein [Eubacteriales bacterium]
MFKCDYHTHTFFSCDGDKTSSPEALCEAAISRGITDLAITDHFEANWRAENLSPPYPAKEAFDAVMSSKQKYNGKINLTYGIEIGQANQYPEEVDKLLKEFNFEFVIASIHNLRGSPDFYYYDFSKIDSEEYMFNLFERNIAELSEVLDVLKCVDTLAHLTYMGRYLSLAGRTYNFMKHKDSLEKLFGKIISRDIALEVNLSTLWKGLGFTMPDTQILSLYRDCGGRLVTVGTDSHSPEHIGECVDEIFPILKSIGLDNILVVRNGEKNVIKI